MNNLNYKKKYLKYKIKYNNLKLYGGNPAEELKKEADTKMNEIKTKSSKIDDLCKKTTDDCINEDEDLINKCQNNIIEFELKYIRPHNLLSDKIKNEYESDIKTVMDNLNYYKLIKACEVNKKNMMYSPIECQQLIDKLKPNLTTTVLNATGNTLRDGLVSLDKTIGDGAKYADKLVDGVVSSFWKWAAGGALSSEQQTKLNAIVAKISTVDKTLYPGQKSDISSKFFNLFDNFESLLRGIGAKFTNLKDMTLNGIKSMTEYGIKKKAIEDELKILEEKKLYLTEIIKDPSHDLVKLNNYERKLDLVNKNIIKTEEALKDLDSPFSLLTIGLLHNISEIAANPLDKIKEMCTNYFMSSLKLIESANELHNYISIIDKYIEKIPVVKDKNHESCKLTLEDHKQKIIIITTQIKIFINQQINNIINISEAEATQKATSEAIASNNFKITLLLSLDPQKIIRKANKIIQKLHSIFILIDTNIYQPPFIDYKNDILSGIHMLKKAAKH